MKKSILSGLVASILTGFSVSDNLDAYPSFKPTTHDYTQQLINNTHLISLDDLDPNSRFNTEPINPEEVYMFFSYDKWLELQKNPHSSISLETRLKAKLITLNGDLAYELLSETDKEEFEGYSSLWEFDEDKYKVNENDHLSQRFLTNLGRNMILDEKRKLSRYDIDFDYDNLSLGEKVLIYFHQKYEARYEKEIRINKD